MKLLRRLWPVILFLCVAIFLTAACVQLRHPDIFYQPTPQEVVEEMLNRAGVTKDDMVYDLGCGDGRFVITAAKKFGARGVGIDIDPDRIKESNENAHKAGVTSLVKFLEGDFFQADISEATVITLFLFPDVNLKLRPKLLRELRPGTRIVSHGYDMGEWECDDSDRVGNKTFYYWVIPGNVGGKWHLNLLSFAGEPTYTLQLAQKFQVVKGKMNIQGKDLRIADPRLTGDKLSFVVRNKNLGQEAVMQFRGHVNGDTLTGTVEVSAGFLAGKHDWMARRIHEKK
jgi:SAM-dependent methyltransferase